MKKIIEKNNKDDYFKYKIVKEAQSEIVAWAKNKFSIIFILVSVVGFYGVNVTIRQILTDDLEKVKSEVAKVQAISTIANSSASKAQEQAHKAEESASTSHEKARAADYSYVQIKKDYDSLTQEMNIKTNEFKDTMKGLEERANGRISLNQNDVNRLEARIEALNKLVEKMASESATNKRLVESYKSDLQRMSAIFNSDKVVYEKNSAYSVEIISSSLDDGMFQTAQNALSIAGYKTSAAEWDKKQKAPRLVVAYSGGQRSIADDILSRIKSADVTIGKLKTEIFDDNSLLKNKFRVMFVD